MYKRGKVGPARARRVILPSKMGDSVFHVNWSPSFVKRKWKKGGLSRVSSVPETNKC